MTNVKVWDIPTRLFHWALVSVFIFQYVSAEMLDDAMQLHFYGGYAALSLIMFRIIWGFVGSYHARFSHFVRSPKAALDYARGDAQTYLGHNPMGAYSVLAILAVMLTQAVSGLFMTDDIFLDGPYYQVFSDNIDDTMNYLHHNIINVMYVLVVLHLIAIAWYSIKKKQRLIPAMLHGEKPVEKNASEEVNGSGNVSNLWLRFVVVCTLVAVTVYLVVEVLPPQPAASMYDY